ncbi:MAG TPA: NAD-dependent epimerase/dehydratase family protein [Isosphaeraceae bacterium]|nr:NAD-dependent epimerase/dehydratase family protein [Isosphaeraceae bacterium]
MSTDASRTIFITGATGLVGSHAVEQALARGHRVRALVRRSSDTRLLEKWGVEKVEGDLEDAEALRRGVEGADWVFNCAAKVGDWGDLDDFRKLNVDALGLLLDAAAQARVERFVHVSSLGVYEGRDHFGTDETTPPALDSLDAYTRSKTEAEALALAYLGELAPRPATLEKLPYAQEVFARRRVFKPNLPVAVLRPGFIYGERDRTVLPKLLGRLQTGVFAYFGSGDQILNCIYVKNLVYAIFLAAEKPEAIGQVFNLTDGGRVSKKAFVGRAAELAGLKPPRRHIPRKLAYILAVLLERRARRKKATEPPLINKARYKFLGLNLDYSIEKARKLLGYQPPFTTEQGLEASLADWKARESGQSRAVATG